MEEEAIFLRVRLNAACFQASQAPYSPWNNRGFRSFIYRLQVQPQNVTVIRLDQLQIAIHHLQLSG